MSGGVDSAVAAARLRDAAYDVVGVTLHLWDYEGSDGAAAHGRCCAPEDQYDARRTADALDFPHYTFDRRELFARTVVGPFVESYVRGETPSPCADCNRGVKLRELFSLADQLGARMVATGHYARVVRTGDDLFLARGKDRAKDQSYFLYATPPEQLARLAFPVGDSTKEEVRREAIARGLPGAEKGESQDLCFVGSKPGAYARFVEERAGERLRPGPIVDGEGRQVGEHQGIHRFTVGQRKGIGVAAAAPLYVTRLDGASGRVHLGQGSELESPGASLDEVVLSPGVVLPAAARVRVRYRHEAVLARLTPGPAVGTVEVAFTEPVRAITPGQVAVFYDGPEGERVLGGGRIRSCAVPACAGASRAL